MVPATRRVVLALALPVLLVVAVGPVAAAPAPSFSVTATETHFADGSCTLTAKASWKNTRVDTVSLSWYFTGGFVATGTAPGSGPDDGVIKGKTATFRHAAWVNGPPRFPWRVEAQFYAAGVLQGQAALDFESMCS